MKTLNPNKPKFQLSKFQSVRGGYLFARPFQLSHHRKSARTKAPPTARTCPTTTIWCHGEVALNTVEVVFSDNVGAAVLAIDQNHGSITVWAWVAFFYCNIRVWFWHFLLFKLKMDLLLISTAQKTQRTQTEPRISPRLIPPPVPRDSEIKDILPPFPRAPVGVGWGPDFVPIRASWYPLNIQMAYPPNSTPLKSSGLREQVRYDSGMFTEK
jgi:hypothetical protein